MGFLNITWHAMGVPSIHGSFDANLITRIPSILGGKSVGSRSTDWATLQIIQRNPRPGQAEVKGLVYGPIHGAITITAGVASLLIIGYYTETIHFNRIQDPVIPCLLMTVVRGGVIHGVTFGALAGIVYGPGLSLYLKF